MKITINSIEAILIDVSTNEKTDYIIDDWWINYTVELWVVEQNFKTLTDEINGKMRWIGALDIPRIIDRIRLTFRC